MHILAPMNVMLYLICMGPVDLSGALLTPQNAIYEKFLLTESLEPATLIFLAWCSTDWATRALMKFVLLRGRFYKHVLPIPMYILVKYTKRLLLRYIHHFKSDLTNNMDHMRISGNEPSSVILIQTKRFQKLKMIFRKCLNKQKPNGMV